jgi:hypothetical protein
MYGDLQAWLEAIGQCPECAAALEAYEPLPPEALECDECMASYKIFLGWLDAVEHSESHVAPEWVTGVARRSRRRRNLRRRPGRSGSGAPS